MGRLESKRVIFTGAVANIGRASVEQFVKEGAQVVIGDRDAAAGERVSEELGPAVHFILVDLMDEASIKAFVAQAAEWLGGVDVVRQNAGLQIAGPTQTFAVEDWNTVYSVNVRAGIANLFGHA